MGENEARYLYSIASCERREELGRIGLEDSMVYTVPWRDISAIVHSCWSRPYSTDDKMLAEEWVLEHSYVIDQATKRFGTVLPFSFDVIIRGDDQVVGQWLSRNYEGLRRELERVQGGSEYSVQIFYDHDKLASKYFSVDPEIKELEEKIAGMSRGTAYLFKRNLDLKLKDKVLEELIKLSDEFTARVLALCEEVKVEKGRVISLPDKYRGLKLMISLSCLVHNDQVSLLGEALDEINNLEGFAVRFTGPWAPFSFVNISEAR